MPGSEVFWRLLGSRARPKAPSEPVPIVDWLKHRIPGPGWRPPLGVGIIDAYRFRGSFGIDPPVGGFAVVDILAEIPGVANGVIIAPTAPTANRAFRPGVFRMLVNYCFPDATAAVTAAYAFWVVPAAAAAVPAQAPLPGRGEGVFVMQKSHTSFVTGRWYEHTFTCEEPWKIFLAPFLAAGDNDKAQIDIDVDCLAPLDMPAGT